MGRQNRSGRSKSGGAFADLPLGATPADAHLLVSASEGNALGIRLALSDGANPWVRDQKARTALMRAAISGSAECVERLLPVSDARACDYQDVNALMLATAHKDSARLKLLLPASDPKKVSDNGKHTALMWAAAAGALDSVKALLPVSDPHARNHLGQTALMLAARVGKARCVQALLPASDPAATDEVGRTALILAAEYQHWACLSALIPVSPARAVDSTGSSALMRACAHGGLAQLGRILPLLARSDWSAKDFLGRDALSRAMGQDRMFGQALQSAHEAIVLRDSIKSVPLAQRAPTRSL